MPRHARTMVDPLVRSYIEEEARADRKATASLIGARVCRRLRKEERALEVPKVRAIQVIAKKARSLPGPSLDDPWSLGVREPEIPPDATGDLLAVWKLSLKLGTFTKFTIRTAKWVARLRSALTGASPETLLVWATLYERRERTAMHTGPPMETADLDAELAFQVRNSSFHEWEHDQAVLTGTVPGRAEASPWHSRQGVEVRRRYSEQSWPILSGDLTSDGRGFLRKVGGKDIDRCSWWTHAESVMAFWLRRIRAGVKKWAYIGYYEYSGSDKAKAAAWQQTTQEWESMGLRLAALVIARAKELEQYEAHSEEIRECWDAITNLEEQKGNLIEQKRIALADKEAERWVPVGSGEGYILISPKVQELDAQLDELDTQIAKVREQLSKLPMVAIEAWRPTELLKEVGYEE